MTPKRARAAARWIMIVAALVVGVPAYAASDGASGTAFYTSCVAAAEIVGGDVSAVPLTVHGSKPFSERN